MKKLLLPLLLFVFSANNTDAQVKLGVNVNIGAQPAWGPVGYERADYYYLPDIGVYYDVPARKYVYLEGSHWVFSSTPPPRYRNYDFYNGYKVVINEPRPYLRDDVYKVKYVKYKNWKGPRQVVIRDKGDKKYYKGDKKYAKGKYEKGEDKYDKGDKKDRKNKTYKKGNGDD